jgi:hypothetical protein
MENYGYKIRVYYKDEKKIGKSSSFEARAKDDIKISYIMALCDYCRHQCYPNDPFKDEDSVTSFCDVWTDVTITPVIKCTCNHCRLAKFLMLLMHSRKNDLVSLLGQQLSL